MNSVDHYWDFIAQGKDAIIDVSSSRFNVDEFYDADRRAPGKTVSRWGGFLDDIDLFDAAFFGISPKEAHQVDPQQRLLLELAWHALESAGIIPISLKGTITGVFTGAMFHDYQDLLLKSHPEGKQGAYYSIGNAFSAIAGRISYTLGLLGPCMALDTACSSSLVAVHEACQNLKNGSCDLAIAGGVNLILTPETSIAYSHAGMLSREGRCKTFSSDANGYVRSEGAGVVILKRLSDALRDHHSVLAIIKGSVANQNGISSGISAPSVIAQEQLLTQALVNANLSPNDINYIEVHGTGTKIGDPIEYAAIKAVYNKTPRKDPLWLGCVKTNIGHCEAASGLAGLIKVILCLNHKKIPRNLNFTALNPRIQLEEFPALIPLDLVDWPFVAQR